MNNPELANLIARLSADPSTELHETHGDGKNLVSLQISNGIAVYEENGEQRSTKVPVLAIKYKISGTEEEKVDGYIAIDINPGEVVNMLGEILDPGLYGAMVKAAEQYMENNEPPQRS